VTPAIIGIQEAEIRIIVVWLQSGHIAVYNVLKNIHHRKVYEKWVKVLGDGEDVDDLKRDLGSAEYKWQL
jgi:hypothetical protein